MDREALSTQAAESVRKPHDNISPQRLLELLGLDPKASDGTKVLWILADVAVSFRRIAGALEHQAAAVPTLLDENARWMYRLAEQSVRERPNKPEKIEDPRTRAAILGLGLGERFGLWSLPEALRRERIEAEKAARQAEQDPVGQAAAATAGGY